jgi:hypothetical protein
MKVRAIMYAAVFTAGVQALAIYSVQPAAVDGVRPAPAALAAAAPSAARAELSVTAPFLMPASPGAAAEPALTRKGALKSANATGSAMASATEKQDNTRPLYDAVVHQKNRMVPQHKMARRQIARWQRRLSMTYARSNQWNNAGNY